MRLRRVELVVVGLTLAFVCFIGGYFTGRTTGAVSIAPTVSSQAGLQPTPGEMALSSVGAARDTGAPPAGADSGADSGAAPGAAQPPEAATSGGAEASTGSGPEAIGLPTGDGKININSASRSELMDLPGIGPALSSRIIDYRNDHGPFAAIEDLRKVSGIGEKKFEAVKEKITV